MSGVLAAEIKSAEGGHYKGDRGLCYMTSKVPSMWQTMWAPLRLRLRLVRKWSKGMGQGYKAQIHHSADVYELETASHSGLSSNHAN